ncbi:MAG TPA: hybrid sensor histidine kinase/response regulator, partial [Firmicutes bacterium]|nr:hybrid sensor histidine kinase/response regulator [Bacillota bacterium]
QDAATWEELGANLKDLEHLVASLQLEVDNLRMVPVKQIFSRFTNYIRKMAQQTKKIVKIELRDQNIKLDKDIAEQLIDPLTQLIKNAIDHGIETPAERKQAGKKEAGTIWLEARQDGKYLHISVRDDGRGLDFIKISSTAVARKLTADQKRFSTDNISELQQIIFTPGFSTSEQVNNLSGRGVGLDIVKTNLDKLQGIIEIISQEQQGATFTLKIPFTFIEGPTLNKGN